MSLGILFLGALTARSQAYAQALEVSNIVPDHVLLFGAGSRSALGRPTAILASRQRKVNGVFVPDLSIPLDTTCGRLCNSVNRLSTYNVNSSEVSKAIRRYAPRLVIYSGYGGQIVSSTALDIGTLFLHIHSGWLPEYRGSTTLYYSLIEEGRCGASAIILAPHIDSGAIVGRRHYRRPPPGIDIDYLYDSAIRADLLVRVMRRYLNDGGFRRELRQDEARATNYYVIHPVLKHLAILSLEATCDERYKQYLDTTTCGA